MPAYGKHVSPAEMDALSAFLVGLRPANQPPAKTAVTPPTPPAGPLAGDFQLDYAAGWHSALGLSQYFSVGWQWDQPASKTLE